MMIIYMAPMLLGCDQREHQKARAAREAELLRQCSLTEEVITFARSLGRADLAEPNASCKTFSLQDCRVNVELLMALAKANKPDISDYIRSNKDCGAEYQFAQKYGMDAFRDHRKLLEAAMEEATAEAQDDRSQDTPDDRSDRY